MKTLRLLCEVQFDKTSNCYDRVIDPRTVLGKFKRNFQNGEIPVNI